MAVDMFLKLDGIKGESLDATHKDWISVLSYSWGVANSASAAPRRRGTPDATSLSVNVYTSKASLPLFNHCCTGAHIKQGMITARKAGEAQKDFLQIGLTDIVITSYHSGSSGVEDLPVETIHLDFAKIQVTYAGQSPTGATLPAISTGFNFLNDRTF